MAFFGLTQLGAQSAFATCLLDTLDITLFSEEELRESFDKIDKDGNSFINRTELVAFLNDVFHGPAPPQVVEKMMKEFDSNADGKITWDEFRITVRRLKHEKEEEAKEELPTSAQEFKSASDIRESMRRHKRPEKDVHEKYSEPMTTSQVVGWDKETGVSEVRYPKKSCTETKFAAAMAQSGVYM